MAKNQWTTRLPDNLDRRVRAYADRENVTNGEALRHYVKVGVEARQTDPLEAGLRTTANIAILGAMMALFIAIPFGYPTPLIGVAAAAGIASILAGVGYLARSGTIEGLDELRRRRRGVRTDGGGRDD